MVVPITMFAQTSVSGTITVKSDGLPLPGVNIILQGTNNGTITDFDGNYSLTGVKSGDLIMFSHVGYTTESVSYTGQKRINIILEADNILEEVVIIGYGSTTKKDATGSLTQINTKQMNKGGIVSADQLLTGRSTGVRIANSGGEPDADPNIRVRGGASLNASNKPLIVIDGVPISNDNPAGQKNPFSLINPNDIESFTILKDASSTAIYGSRASNGVIIITTKKGTSGETKYNFSSNVQVGKIARRLDLLSSDEYVDFIRTNYPDEVDLLGVNGKIYDTDWQDEIYRTSITTDNNFSVRSNLFGKVPIRASIGHSDIQGVLIESALERFTGSVNLSPKLFKNHLKITTNLKGVLTRKDQPDEEAIGSALSANPTLPVLDPDGNDFFGGFYQTVNNVGGVISKTGPTNPIAQLKQRNQDEDADRFLGNIEFDYKMHFLPDLRAVLNLGLDHSKSIVKQFFDERAITEYRTDISGNPVYNGGNVFREDQEKTDKLLDAYLSYTKSFDGFLSKIDAQGGYSYQDFRNEGTKSQSDFNGNGERIFLEEFAYLNPINLQSYFGRLNIGIKDKYLLTASYRTDASSLFSPDLRWGSFPSAAVAWKIGEENWFVNSKVVSALKLRLGWGVTGQQNIQDNVGYFPYIPLYLPGNGTVQYSIGNDSNGDPIFVTTNAAIAFNPNLEWEKTTTYNAGIDFDFWDGVFSGSFDIYRRDTEDLLADVQQPEGSLKNIFTQNIGKTESKGFEVAVNFIPVRTDNVTWDLNANISYNETIIKDLGNNTQVTQGDTGIGRGTGVNIGAFAVGEQVGTFWLYEQIYDVNGKPIPDAFVDQNGDNVINDEDRLFTPYVPKFTYGFGTNCSYKNLDFTANFRGQLGGKIYNSNLLNKGYQDAVLPLTGNGFLNNALDLYDGTIYDGFTNNPSDSQALSDFYISDATFLRLDNITLGYTINGLLDNKVSMRIYASVNNVFTITDYEGIDPDSFNGIETSPYARPRTFTVGLNMDF